MKRESKIKTKKSLGQCFLVNQHIAEKIGSEVNSPESVVLEIGPGTGMLTEKILQNKNVKHLVVIEKDKDLIDPLTDKFKQQINDGMLTVINEDALKIDIYTILNNLGFTEECNKGEIFMISNLPYNVGTLIVINMMYQIDIFTKIVVMLQEEVIDRIVAKPKSKSYSVISVIVQSVCKVKKIMSISPSQFRPMPKVQSAIIRIERKLEKINKEVFNNIVKISKVGFSKRRKMFLKNINDLKNSKLSKIVEGNIEKNKRIEEIDVETIIKIAHIADKEKAI